MDPTEVLRDAPEEARPTVQAFFQAGQGGVFRFWNDLSGEERGQHKFQGMGPGFIPPILDRSVIDEVRTAWEEDAFPMARRLAREEGLFVGMSSGAIVWVAVQLATELGPGKRVACIAPDSASRYLTTELFADE